MPAPGREDGRKLRFRVWRHLGCRLPGFPECPPAALYFINSPGIVGFLINYLLVIVMTIILYVIVYKLIERPGVKIDERFVNSLYPY